MPGIETRAPLRTETSSGFAAAEALAGARLEFAHRGRDLVLQARREIQTAGRRGRTPGTARS
jgi:hypothetical protein